jgi:glycosyltransferase involved in cell wall biosynthesis
MTFRASIVLPCHNVEDYVDTAFESIARQSLFTEMEVIPVDDGSTDSTWEAIERWAHRYPDNIFPVRCEVASGGPSRPRNIGLDRARSEYIIFMDPDDRIHEDGYSLLVDRMDRYQSDIVIAARYGVPEGEGPEKKKWTDYVLDEEIVNGDGYDLKVDLLQRRPVILKSIYRASKIAEHSLRFREDISTSEDEIFDMKYLLLSNRITKINDVVYLYTVERTGSVTSRIGLTVYEELTAAFDGLDDALSVYFNQEVVSWRLASLLRTFYLPKLLLLEPDLLDDALDLLHRACATYGFDRLRLTEHQGDRELVELLEGRRYTQLVLRFMQDRNAATKRAVRIRDRQLRARKRLLKRRPVRLALRFSQFTRRWKDAIASREVRKYLVARRVEGGFSPSSNGYWVFMDRRDKGGDNAEALYRYVRDEGLHDRIAFVIDEGCRDHHRLTDEGFNLVPYGTIEHWRLLYGAEHFFASHVDDVIIYPWKRYGSGIENPRYKLNFLQHGVIRSDLSSWLGSKSFHTFMTSAKPEYTGILNNLNYRVGPETLQLTGLARHDLLDPEQVSDYLLIAPTWRSFLLDVPRERFEGSEFFRAWAGLLGSSEFEDLLSESGLEAKLLLHPSIDRYRRSFGSIEHIEVMTYTKVPDFSKLISGARGLVTDYSTIAFDSLYLRRPCLFYTFPEQRTHSTNAGAKLNVFEQLGFLCGSQTDVLSTMKDLTSAGWTLDPGRSERADDFFAFRDRDNRRRIIEAVLEKDRHDA